MYSGEALPGGNIFGVWRVGDTVRRKAGPWTPQVHRLLAHLRSRGITYVPEPLGMDEEGRENLTYLPGIAGGSPLVGSQRSDAVLVRAATMLRALHDATVDVAADWCTGWRLPARDPVEVICHGDFAPYNCVFVDDELTGVIDFDFAHAGPREWDLAYALYRFVPLADPAETEGFGTPADQARRLRLFCDVYGLTDRSRVYTYILARIQWMIDFLLEGVTVRDPRRLTNIEAGHLVVYRHDRWYVDQHRELFEAALR
ncbi:MAG: aminoglycoside phosphotransferase family protein [Anaerolineae bacterium]|nr:aminoglycoside phosphotransferase family protein [Anaerolineae bacterium]MCB0205015.1 aminoglycoside phosphotransferase family protein [Anaerolineae bacterium]